MRTGVIGCGAWGGNHARTLARMGVLAAVADAVPDRAGALARDLRCAAPSPAALLADPAIDAVVIALDPRAQPALALEAIAAGKHVLVEKPMALDAGAAARIVAAAQERGVVAMTGHIIRFHPAFTALERLVAEGALGQLTHIRARRMGWGRFFPGVSVIWDFAPHDLSLILALTGSAPMEGSAAWAAPHSDTADLALLRLSCAGGVHAEIALSRLSQVKQRRLEIAGTRGRAVFDDLAPEGEKLTLVPVGGAPRPVPCASDLPLDAELRHFVESAAAGGASLSTAQEGLSVLRTIEALDMTRVQPDALPPILHPGAKTAPPQRSTAT